MKEDDLINDGGFDPDPEPEHPEPEYFDDLETLTEYDRHTKLIGPRLEDLFSGGGVPFSKKVARLSGVFDYDEEEHPLHARTVTTAVERGNPVRHRHLRQLERLVEELLPLDRLLEDVARAEAARREAEERRGDPFAESPVAYRTDFRHWAVVRRLVEAIRKI